MQDYIASGTIGTRLETVIPQLGPSYQTGYLPGRYIGENTRLIYDILQHTEENNIAGLLLMIDFEKAFDSVSTQCNQHTGPHPGKQTHT